MEVNTQIKNTDDEMEIDLKELFFVLLHRNFPLPLFLLLYLFGLEVNEPVFYLHILIDLILFQMSP